MRILQLNGSRDFGGAEQSTLTISLHMSSRGHEVYLAARSGSKLAERAHALGLNVVEPAAYARWPFASLAKFVREHGIDILHSHLLRATRLAFTTSWLTGVPVIAHARVNKKNRVYRWAAARGRLIAVSQSTADYYVNNLAVPPDNISVIINATRVQERQGADLDRADAHEEITEDIGCPSSARLIMLFGRLTAQKGQDIAVEAMPAVLERIPEAKLILVGPAHDRHSAPFVEQLTKRIADLSLEDHVVVLGERTDVARLLRAADLAIVPSRYDPCPNTVMEATMLGAPLVAAGVGGIPEQLDAEGVAVMIPPEDAAATAQAITDVLEDPEAAGRMAARAQAHAERCFSPKRLMDEIEEVYHEVLNARQAS